MKTEEHRTESPPPNGAASGNLNRNLMAMGGAIAGAVLGYFGYCWLLRQGLYALALPGALIGLGASAFKPSSKTLCIVTGVSALAAGLFTEWRNAPFSADGSLLYFLAHVYQLRPMTLIMIAIGVVAGFAIPLRRPSP
jgi:hypothetical protein